MISRFGPVIFMSTQYLLAVQTSGGSLGWLGFAPLIFIFAIFYFLLILPKQRRQKKWQAMLDAVDALARDHAAALSAVEGVGLSGQMH